MRPERQTQLTDPHTSEESSSTSVAAPTRFLAPLPRGPTSQTTRWMTGQDPPGGPIIPPQYFPLVRHHGVFRYALLS